jgi:hypothetical protein
VSILEVMRLENVCNRSPQFHFHYIPMVNDDFSLITITLLKSIFRKGDIVTVNIPVLLVNDP